MTSVLALKRSYLELEGATCFESLLESATKLSWYGHIRFVFFLNVYINNSCIASTPSHGYCNFLHLGTWSVNVWWVTSGGSLAEYLRSRWIVEESSMQHIHPLHGQTAYLGFYSLLCWHQHGYFQLVSFTSPKEFSVRLKCPVLGIFDLTLLILT